MTPTLCLWLALLLAPGAALRSERLPADGGTLGPARHEAALDRPADVVVTLRRPPIALPPARRGRGRGDAGAAGAAGLEHDGNGTDTARARRAAPCNIGTCCNLTGVVSINKFVLGVTVNVLSLDRKLTVLEQRPRICLEALVQPTTEVIVAATPNNPCPQVTQHEEFAFTGLLGHSAWTLDNQAYTLDTVGTNVVAPITDTSSDTIQFRVIYSSADGLEELGEVASLPRAPSRPRRTFRRRKGLLFVCC